MALNTSDLEPAQAAQLEMFRTMTAQMPDDAIHMLIELLEEELDSRYPEDAKSDGE